LQIALRLVKKIKCCFGGNRRNHVEFKGSREKKKVTKKKIEKENFIKLLFIV